jgi:uncharacterized membrane protein YraQ (UPF0718 family)
VQIEVRRTRAARAIAWPTSQTGALPWAVLVGALVVWWLLYRSLGPAAEAISYRLLGLGRDTRLGSAVAFFLYDTPKVLLLLVLVVFAVAVLRSFFSPERSRQLLAGRRKAVGNVLAAGLGVATPFCSCSAVPLFLGFVEVGVPLGVTFSFLIAAPMVNEVALVLLFGLFGWRTAALYLGAGLTVAIAAGWVLGRLRLEGHLEPWVRAMAGTYHVQDASRTLAWAGRLRAGGEAVRQIVGRVWPYVVAGIAVGAGIHGYVPDGLLAGVMGDQWWAVPLAVLIGVPMYANAAGIVPVVQALLAKGAALGTVLAFMMAVIGLSLPETIILRKVLRPPLIAAFVGIVGAGILLVGYLFNLIM